LRCIGELGLHGAGQSTRFAVTSQATRLELTKFHNPTALSAEPKNAPVNTLGIRRIMFAVEDIDEVLARLRAHGAELVGELEQYEDSYRLCYVRGPEGIIIALAEQLS
jgi:catechol 2,3-dioxygenase-like lactoylglutathione lyase family enzyme